ncbi:unnamed protein product [Lupinus luteus]|uniref:Purple acid phosphatase n=1 Tax=Lupinus luteus TaxID=3873 RepID=A0AAV1Y7M4_LUPLU
MGLLIFIATIALCLVVSSAWNFQHNPSTKPDGSVSFLVIGDWGRNGAHNQKKVANQMGIIAKKLDINFVISTGDNFYEKGLRGIRDPAFGESFIKIYTAPGLQKQWYNALGEHDYRGDVEAQVSPNLPRHDMRWICRRYYMSLQEVAEFFFIDTTPFVNEYFKEPAGINYNWTGILPRAKYLDNLIEDLDLALKESRAKWKFVVGHHPIKNAGKNGVTKELQEVLLPILEKHKVDVYMNGHDHSLHHISSKIEFLTSGGGSMALKGIVPKWDPKELKFFHSGEGFMSVEITKNKGCLTSCFGPNTKLEIAFYDVDGKVLYKWNKSK